MVPVDERRASQRQEQASLDQQCPSGSQRLGSSSLVRRGCCRRSSSRGRGQAYHQGRAEIDRIQSQSRFRQPGAGWLFELLAFSSFQSAHDEGRSFSRHVQQLETDPEAQLNIALPATGLQKSFAFDDEKKTSIFYDKSRSLGPDPSTGDADEEHQGWVRRSRSTPSATSSRATSPRSVEACVPVLANPERVAADGRDVAERQAGL